MSLLRATAVLAALAPVVLAAQPALAQGAKKKAAPAVDVAEGEADPDAGKARPPASDTRFGHFLIDLKGGLAVPAGSVSAGLPINQVATTGPLIGGAIGFGIGRNAVIQVDGSYDFFAASTICSGSGCKGHSYDVGIGLRYHLAQGISFDPWTSFGAGYRSSTFAVQPLGGATRATETFKGIDIVRLAIGGDFYPFSFAGFGPYIGLDIGTNTSRPDNRGFATYAVFELGVRVAFDPMRASSRPRASAGRASRAPEM